MDDGKTLKKFGMEQVARHADPAWMAAADFCARVVISRQHDFTSDDVHALMRVRFPDVRTHDKRAMGPIIGKLARRGFIVKAPRLPVPSVRATRHAAPLTVWRPIDPLS